MLLERIVELSLLIVAALPLARTAFDPGLRRRFAAFPPIQPLLPFAVPAYAIGLAVVCVFAPGLLRAGAVGAAALILYDLIQRRPEGGSNRRLPAGSMEFFPRGPWRDPHHFRKAAARWGPIFKFRHLTRPAIAITGMENISTFLQKHSADLSSPPAPFNAIVSGGFVRYMDGDEHLDTASLLRVAISRTVVEQCGETVAAECRTALDAIACDSVASVRALDIMVFNVLTRCFTGLGSGPETDHFESLYAAADYRALARNGKARAARAMNQIVETMQTMLERNDLPASFLSELRANNPSAVRSDRMMANFAYALHTARVDTADLMTWLIAVAGDNPQWVVRLRDECRTGPAVTGLADRMVRETLRMRQSEFILRRANTDIEFMGFVIPRGWHVRLCVAESHRSADVFPDPDRFDPDRFLTTPSRQRYAPFGFAPHLCPGEHLTRWIGRTLLVELARGFDIRVSSVEPWEFGGFHWRPNEAMRVILTPVET
jgi:cytochrome P450